MSVGKESIKRAASAGAKAVEAAAETKAAETAAKPAAKKPAARKTAAKKAAPANTEVVSSNVLTPMDAEEIQVKFLSGKKADEDTNRPVRITEEMPVYLL